MSHDDERTNTHEGRPTVRPATRPTLGFALSSEEHSATELADQAVMAEQAGFRFALISDHFHPWTPRQGQSPFVWGVIGAIAARTSSLTVGTGVTCPILRLHPAIVAQASATAATQLPGRFWLGLGSGERLNEHVIGERWPSTDERVEMLAEAVEVIRGLWTGERYSHRGRSFAVEDARLFSHPEAAPPILMAAAITDAAKAAGNLGDGLIATRPEAKIVEAYRAAAGGRIGPRVGQLTVCWASDEATARATAHEWWPNAAIEGSASQELARPEDFEALARGVTEAQVADAVICGPDPDRYRGAIDAFATAGFDHVYVHQVGPDQAGFIDFARTHLLG